MVVAACDGPAPGTSEIIANAGHPVIHNAARGSWSPADAWRVVEELRIGAAAGDGPTVFGDVVDVDIDEAGRLFVLDRQAREVRVFGPDGEHIRSIGRPGGGPGEFRNPTAVALRPDGTIWVIDLPGNGYSVFDTTGTFIRAHPSVGMQSHPWPGGFDEAGHFYDWNFRQHDDGSPESLLIAYSPGDGFVPVDTVWLPLPELEEIELPGGGSMRKPFGSETHWHLDPRGYLWAGKDDGYRIVQMMLTGDTARVIEKEHDPAAVTRADAEAALDRIAPVLARHFGTGQPSDIALPKRRPVYEAFVTDNHGYLWVNRTLAEDRAMTAQYDVFDPNGMFVGEVVSPIGAWEWGTKPVFRGDIMAGVVTDSFGVDYVVRVRIERGW